MLLQIQQSRRLKVSPEGDREEDNRMLCWDQFVQFLQPQIYLNTFAKFYLLWVKTLKYKKKDIGIGFLNKGPQFSLN